MGRGVIILLLTVTLASIMLTGFGWETALCTVVLIAGILLRSFVSTKRSRNPHW